MCVCVCLSICLCVCVYVCVRLCVCHSYVVFVPHLYQSIPRHSPGKAKHSPEMQSQYFRVGGRVAGLKLTVKVKTAYLAKKMLVPSDTKARTRTRQDSRARPFSVIGDWRIASIPLPPDASYVFAKRFDARSD